MFGTLKRVWWDLKDPTGRFHYANAVWSRLPGAAGEWVRARRIPRHFAAAGSNILIQENVRFRGLHRLRVGDDCGLGVGSFLQASGGITLGDRVLLGPYVMIWSINHVYTDADRPIAEQGFEREEVIIEDDCWLGASVFVHPGVHLPPGCVVSAGSVVGKRRYPPWSILAGFPAKVVGTRRPGDPDVRP